MKQNIVYLILGIVLIISIFVRFDGVFSLSFAYTYDVGRDMLALSQIAQTHKIPLIGFTTGQEGIFYGPWWYYIIFPSFILSNGNPQAVAGFIAFLGVLAVFMGFLIGKYIKNIEFGLLCSGILAVSTTVISTSNQIWNPNLAPIVLMMILYLLVVAKHTQKHQNINAFFLGLLSTLLLEAEIIYGSLTFVATIIFLLFFLRERISTKSVSLFLLGVLVILSPRILFEFRHQFLMTHNILKYLSSNASSSRQSDIISIFINRLQVFSQLWLDTIARGDIFIGIVFSIIWSIGIFQLFRSKDNKLLKSLFIYCLLSVGVFIIGLSILHTSFYGYYFVGVPLIFAIIFSIGIWSAIRSLSVFIEFIIACCIVLYLFNPINRIQEIRQPLWIGDASVYRNQLQVIDYTYQQANRKPFKYVVYTPPVHDYTYQYLYQWYGSKKYHYAPSVQTAMAFFILEPDLQFPIREKIWLQQRQKDGAIKKSVTFPSGIIVQTREPK